MMGPAFLGCPFLADEKNEPKKLGSSFLISTSKSRLLLIWPGGSFPDLASGTGVGGLLAFSLSCTIDIACGRCMSSWKIIKVICTRPVSVKEVGVSRVDITCLHPSHQVHKNVEKRWNLPFWTHETMSVTSFVVGFIAVLKKLITTELKRSRSAGKRLKACCMVPLALYYVRQSCEYVRFSVAVVQECE